LSCVKLKNRAILQDYGDENTPFCHFVFSLTYASPLGDVIRDIDAASAKIFNFCTYTFKYKEGSAGGPEKVIAAYAGNEFFIEHDGMEYIALTNLTVLRERAR